MAGAGGGGAGGVVVRPGEGGQQQPAGRHGRDTLDIETETGAGAGKLCYLICMQCVTVSPGSGKYLPGHFSVTCSWSHPCPSISSSGK